MERASEQPGTGPGPTIGPATADWVAFVSRLSRSRRFGCRLLDARSGPNPPSTHVPGSAWLPTLDGHDLPAHMLPARSRGFHVFGNNPEHARLVAAALRARGYRAADVCEQIPVELWRPGPPEGALWSPDPYLARRLDSLPAPGVGRVLDLGCGSGRDAVFLALHGYDVLAVDRLPDALELGRWRARHHGVDIQWRHRRIVNARDLPEGPFALVLALRFLPRAALSQLHSRVLPGAQFILDVYGLPDPSGSESQHTDAGPRRSRHRILPEELRDDLAGSGWKFVHGPLRRRLGRSVWVRATASWGASPEPEWAHGDPMNGDSPSSETLPGDPPAIA